MDTMELAQRCGFDLAVVRRWIDTDGEEMTVRELLTLQRVIRTRGEFLLDGKGPVLPLALCPLTVQMVLLLDSMSQNAARIWLRYGRRLQGR